MVRYQKGEGAVYVALVPLKNRILVCKIPLAGTRFLYGSGRFGVIILELWPPQAVKVAVGGLHDSVVLSVTTVICVSR